MLVLTPAYGRDYSKVSDVLHDLSENLDFVLCDEPYTTYANKSDLLGHQLQIRYSKLRKFVLVKIDRDGRILR
jgi:hypothetical protein